jgi:hypothetical protein
MKLNPVIVFLLCVVVWALVTAGGVALTLNAALDQLTLIEQQR